MATISEIKQGLRAILKARIPDLMVYGDVPDVTQLPAVVVLPARPTMTGLVCDFDGAFGRGLYTWHVNVFILVARTDGAAAQRALDAYISGSGPLSIPQAVYESADLGLGGSTDAHALGIHDYGGSFEAAGIDHVGAVMRLIVRTDA